MEGGCEKHAPGNCFRMPHREPGSGEPAHAGTDETEAGVIVGDEEAVDRGQVFEQSRGSQLSRHTVRRPVPAEVKRPEGPAATRARGRERLRLLTVTARPETVNVQHGHPSRVATGAKLAA